MDLLTRTLHTLTLQPPSSLQRQSGGGIIVQFLMLLNMLLKPNSIWQMQLFQINQSEDSSKITIMFNNPSGQFHQCSITSAFNYNRTYSSCDAPLQNWILIAGRRGAAAVRTGCRRWVQSVQQKYTNKHFLKKFCIFIQFSMLLCVYMKKSYEWSPQLHSKT